MNTGLTNAIRCATKDIIEAITGNKSVDYTSLLTSIKDSVSAIDANTDNVENLLEISNINTAETVTKLNEAIAELKAINADTGDQEALLSDILAELRKLATVPVPMGTSCVSINGKPAQYADVIALYNNQGAHLATDFSVVESGKLTFYTESDVAILSDCDCADCADCDSCSTSIMMLGYDNANFDDFGEAGYNTVFKVNGGTAIVHDYMVSSDGQNKSSFYAPVTDAINALPNWSIEVDTDVSIKAGGKVKWKVTYTGSGNETLEIKKADSVAGVDADYADVLTISVDSNCTLKGVSSWDGQGSDPFTS